MHVLPAEFRPFGIGEDICGFDAQAVRVLPRGNGSCGQLPDLIVSAERFSRSDDHPLAVEGNELHEALDVVGGKCICERLDEVGSGCWLWLRVRK